MITVPDKQKQLHGDERKKANLRNMLSLWRSRRNLTLLTLFAGRGGQIIAQLITINLLTRLLIPEEVGRYYLLITIQGWINMVFFAAPTMYLARNYLEWQHRDAHAAALMSLLLNVFLVTLLGFPLVEFVLRFARITSSTHWLTSFVVVAFLCTSVIAAQASALLNLMEERVKAVLIPVGVALLGLVAAFLFVKLMSPKAEAWMIGLVVGQGIIGVVGGRAVLRASKLNREKLEQGSRQVFRVSREQFKRALIFIWPVALITICQWAQTQGYRIPLSFSLDVKAVGLFAVAYSMGATIMVAAETVLMQWIMPPFFKTVVGMDTAQINAVWQDYFAFLIQLIIPLTAFAVFAAPFMLRLLAGPAFQTAVFYTLWGGLAECFRIIGSLFYLGSVGRRNTKKLVVPYLIGAVFALVGAYALTWLWSLQGAGLSVTLSFLVLAFVCSFVQRNPLGKIRLLDFRFAALASLVIIAVLVSGIFLGFRESFLLSGLTVCLSMILLAGVTLVLIQRNSKNLTLL